MMAFLRGSGMKVVVWLTPFVNVRSNDEGIGGQNLGRASTYDAAAAAGYFVRATPGGAPLVSTWWKGDGSPVDFTNPSAATWFKAQLQALVAASGGVIGKFKTDDGETDYIRSRELRRRPHRRGDAQRIRQYLSRCGTCRQRRPRIRAALHRHAGVPGDLGRRQHRTRHERAAERGVSAALSSAMRATRWRGSDIGGSRPRPSATPEDLFCAGRSSARSPDHADAPPVATANGTRGATATPRSRTTGLRAAHRAVPYLYTYARPPAARHALIRPLLNVVPTAAPQRPTNRARRCLPVGAKDLSGTGIALSVSAAGCLVRLLDLRARRRARP
jgi:alpha-glucosidase (family GH31 glycosyl hydrolase)